MQDLATQRMIQGTCFEPISHPTSQATLQIGEMCTNAKHNGVHANLQKPA